MRMSHPEDTLALAAATGDADAFAALLEGSYDRLFALCFRLTGRRAEAEDLTQDICAALPAKLRSYRGEARFTTWLYRVAVNANTDRIRKAGRQARTAIAWGEVEVLQRDAAREAATEAEWLADAMARLPDDLRVTLALTVDEGITQAQAAEVLGLSEGTVAWRMSEVKKRLKEMAAEDLI